MRLIVLPALSHTSKNHVVTLRLVLHAAQHILTLLHSGFKRVAFHLLALQVIPNRKPDDWNLPSIYLISATLGGIACVSSLILLFMGLDSSRENSLLHKWGLGHIEYEEIVTMMYLKVRAYVCISTHSCCSRCCKR
jgi:hypothetical protein